MLTVSVAFTVMAGSCVKGDYYMKYLGLHVYRLTVYPQAFLSNKCPISI